MKQTEPGLNADDYRKTADYQSAEAFLLSRIDFERMAKMPYSRKKLNLDRMACLLELLNNPHQQVDLIHVAGTKGKGSTVAFLVAALAAQGLRCGSYTSPHLHHVEERFCVNQRPAHPADFVALVETLRPNVEYLDRRGPDHQVTYFEIATAIAFLYFVQQKIDIGILEVGLGGRLDSTNVCLPLVSIITSISLDHTKQLGDTLELIAAEKAGIIKPDVPVVSGVTAVEPRNVIRDLAARNNSPYFERDRDFRFSDYQPGSIRDLSSVGLEKQTTNGWQAELEAVQLGSPGEHQAANASVAWTALQLLPEKLRPDAESIRAGFASAGCEARIEIVSPSPLTIFDSAHNPASAAALAKTLLEYPVQGQRWLILATTKGKDLAGILQHLVPVFDQIVCTRYLKNPRSHEPHQIAELAQKTADGLGRQTVIAECDSPDAAWKRVTESIRPEDLLCVTGSFFIAAEVRELMDE